MSPAMNRTRVYAPETNEPFDVTPSKAGELILLKGWTKTPVTRTPVAENAAVSETQSYVTVGEADVLVAEAAENGWRSSRARGRKTSGSEPEIQDEA